MIDEAKLAELRARREATPEADWDGVEEWIERSLALTKPGGVVATVLPDGKPFVVRKPLDCGPR